MKLGKWSRRLKDPPAALASVAAVAGAAHLTAARFLSGKENVFYAVFFFSVAAALVISLYRLFLRRRSSRRGSRH